MGYIRDNKDNIEKIQREGAIERAKKTNSLQLKLREKIQNDEQTKVTKYGEGFCYGCAKTDKILSTLILACESCLRKRGKEGLLAVVFKKPIDDLCDFCGFYKFGICQINCSLCDSCMKKIHELHRKYREGGGMIKQHPYFKKLRRTQGKDMLYNMFPARRINL